MEYIFENLSLCDVEVFKNKQNNVFYDKWKEGMLYKPKLRLYVLYKNVFKPENYVLLNLERSNRSILAQLRLGILPLRIETGRMKNEKPHERICMFCNSGSIEDEYHFLFNCTLYNKERESLFEYIIKDNESFVFLDYSEKMKYLCENNTRLFSKFIQECYNIRLKKMYKNN